MSDQVIRIRTGYVTAEVRAPADVDLAAVAAAVDPMLPGGFRVAPAAGEPGARIDTDRTTGLPQVAALPDGRIRIQLGTAALAGPTLGFVLYTVTERARQHHGMVTVHAAAALDPSGTAAMLLLGDKGAGKTSTLLALLERGFAFVGDDLVVLAAGTSASSEIRVLPGRRRAAVRRPGAVLGYEHKDLLDQMTAAGTDGTVPRGWPVSGVARVSVHPHAAAAVTGPARLSATERLRLAENVGRYIAGTVTPLALGPAVHAPVYPLDDSAASGTRTELLGRLDTLGLHYLQAPTAAIAAELLADAAARVA